VSYIDLVREFRKFFLARIEGRKFSSLHWKQTESEQQNECGNNYFPAGDPKHEKMKRKINFILNILFVSMKACINYSP
jgi:hypothetical protein